jgi:hypothetical protein
LQIPADNYFKLLLFLEPNITWFSGELKTMVGPNIKFQKSTLSSPHKKALSGKKLNFIPFLKTSSIAIYQIFIDPELKVNFMS